MANNKKPAPAPKAAGPKIPARTTSAPAAKAASPVSTPVRNSAVPKPTTSAPSKPTQSRVITHDMIAKRAYEISQSPQCGSEYDNWIRAERELKAQ